MNLKFYVLPGGFTPKIKYEDSILLFDTGASTPVWCYSVTSFKRKFPRAEKMNYKFLLTGFGRSEMELVSFLRNPSASEVQNYFVDVYSIPEFILKTEDGQIIWKNLNVAVTDRKFSGVHMILPYTIFGGMELKFNQNTINPKIIIESPRNIKYTFVKLNNNFNENILQYIYSQDEPGKGLTRTMDIF